MAADDEHGDRWLLWKEDGNAFGRPTPIWAQRLSADGIVLQGEPVELFRNDAPWEGHLVEAPHVVRRGEWFYLFYSGNACCGEDCAYAVGVARARSLTGPWEKCPRNPILASNDAFRCPGHGAPVDDGQGRFWYLYHAYETGRDAIYVGRQLCVDAVAWDVDGWPSINGGRGPSRIAPRPFPGEPQRAQREGWTADFGAPLDRLWQWPQSHEPDVDRERGELVVRVGHVRRQGDPLAAVLARPIACGDFVAETTVEAIDRDGTLRSLVAYGTQRDALGIGVRDGYAIVWRRRGGRFVELERLAIGNGSVHLRCTARDGNAYRFAFSREGRRWTTLGGRLDGSWLPPWDAGVRVALAVGGVKGDRGRFGSLRIAPLPASVTALPPERPRVAFPAFLRRGSALAVR
jgi:beta-xylosidase